MPEELKLSEDPKIIEIECQTKERPGFKAKSWRVCVENRKRNRKPFLQDGKVENIFPKESQDKLQICILIRDPLACLN